MLVRCRLLVFCALAFIVGALTAPILIPRFADRWIAADLSLDGSGPVAVRWSNAATSNGLWLDFDDPFTISKQTAPGTRTIHLTHRLPSYAIDELRIEALAETVTIGRPKVYTYLFNVRLPTQSLEVHSAAAAANGVGAATSRAVTLSPGQPAIWRVVGWRGVLLCGLAGMGLMLLWLGVRRMVRAIDSMLVVREGGHTTDDSAPPSCRPACPPSCASFWWPRITVALCVASPILMALWPPMFLTADTTAYLWFAQLLLKTGTIEHFDGWRLPGYGLLLTPFIAALRDYAPAVGMAQCLMGIATNLLVFSMLHRRVRPLWACLATIMVAIDPVLLGWQRFVMAETASALCIAAGAWLFLRLTTPVQSTTSLRRTLGLALLLGGACTAAILLRGNNLILPTVLIAALVWCGAVSRRRELFAAAPAAALVIALALLPLFILNHRHYGRFTLAVGGNFTRSLFSWENETTDWNQCGTLSFDEFKEFRAMLRERPMTDWDVMEWMSKTNTVRVPADAAQWLAMDVRSGALADESLARLATVFTRRQYQASLGLLGIPVTEPAYALGGTWGMFAQLMGREYHRTTTNFDFVLDKFPPEMQDLILRSTHDVTSLRSSPIAHAFGWWFDLWKWWRAVLGVLFVLAVIRLLARGQWALAAVGVVVLGNIVGVPVMTYAAEYRYAAPFYPLVAVTIALGLASPPRLRIIASNPQE